MIPLSEPFAPSCRAVPTDLITLSPLKLRHKLTA